MRIVFCNCSHADVVPEKVKGTVLHWLGTARAKIEVVSDLCELAARRDPRLVEWSRKGELRVVACYPRVVEWLFHAAGATELDGRLKTYNLRTTGAGRILEELLTGLETVCACRAQTLTPPTKGAWAPWFPVIDYSRCTNCKQCLSFCLFGVFATDEDGRVTVQNPDHCKTNCPACARVCPNVAIMFPKHDQRPINGDEVLPEDLRKEAVQVDTAQLMAGDIHAKLRARRKGARFTTDGGEHGVDSLKRLQGELDIPDEVIASLGCACQRPVGAESKTNPDSDKKEGGTAPQIPQNNA